jgi:hypothetical protein
MSVAGQSALTTALSPEAEARVLTLMARMTLAEKLAQLVGLWEGRAGRGGGGDVAPMQDAMQAQVDTLEVYARSGLGQLTRVFGTAPVEPAEGASVLAAPGSGAAPAPAPRAAAPTASPPAHQPPPSTSPAPQRLRRHTCRASGPAP